MDIKEILEELNIKNNDKIVNLLKELYLEIKKQVQNLQTEKDNQEQKLLDAYNSILSNLLELSKEKKLSNESRQAYLLKADEIKQKKACLKEK